MANEVEITVRVTDDTRTGNAAVRRGSDDLTRHAEQNGQRAQRGIGLMGKAGELAGKALKAGAVVGAAGIGLLTGFIAEGVQGAIRYEVLQKKTAQVIKSTGNEAHVSVKGIQALAGELESLSGVDEELIITSQNVLLTFTNIKNVGKDKIFDQATRSALDMSVALGTDLQGASIQVGKALNDPIKGVSALSKVGVSFTEGQKKTIKSLVESGKTMDAQKLILKELNKEFGGQAKAAGETFAGSWARAQDALADTGRAIGQEILPKLTELADWLAEKIPEAVDGAKHAWKEFVAAFNGNPIDTGNVSALGSEMAGLKDEWAGLIGAFKDSTPTLEDNSKALEGEKKSFTGLVAAIAGSVGDIGSWLRQGVLAVQEFGENIQKKVLSTVLKVQETLGKMPDKLGGAKWRRAAAETRADLQKIQDKLDRTNTKQLQAQADRATTKLQRLGRQRPTPKVTAQIADAQRKIDQITAKLRNIPDQYVNVFISELNRDRATANRGKRSGGIANAATGGARGGLTWVGEAGPELVRLPSGSSVLSAGDSMRANNKNMTASGHPPQVVDTAALAKKAAKAAAEEAMRAKKAAEAARQAMLTAITGLNKAARDARAAAEKAARDAASSGSSGSGSGGDGRVVIEFTSDGSRMGELILDLTRKAIRARGGNVQLVLGS